MRGKSLVFSGEEEYNKGKKEKGETGDMDDQIYQKRGPRTFTFIGLLYVVLGIASICPIENYKEILMKVNLGVAIPAGVVTIVEFIKKVCIFRGNKAKNRGKENNTIAWLDKLDLIQLYAALSSLVLWVLFVISSKLWDVVEKYANAASIFPFSFFFFNLVFDEKIEKQKKNHSNDGSGSNPKEYPT